MRMRHSGLRNSDGAQVLIVPRPSEAIDRDKAGWSPSRAFQFRSGHAAKLMRSFQRFRAGGLHISFYILRSHPTTSDPSMSSRPPLGGLSASGNTWESA